MDLENQRRIKKFAEQYGTENIVVVLGSYESEAAAIIAQTVTDGDPSLTGPLARVQLGLKVYHICENEIRQEVPAYVYDDEIGMMDMVIDVPDVCAKLSEIRNLYCKY